ncbi:sugar phosphate isomerase/epimerase family protein [Aneurinibacillus tyrosinisolvens]|uniref:sugar phosphate isomerase/epimerase family protein n=1 Tax=Aneurinibacillus tyrosinisolvens TaxID=1443435 RepID=UPI000A6CC8F5|nr:sugar phosphate isomerase/epimerase [Aneurinibacillus tyrosinisolvens]
MESDYGLLAEGLETVSKIAEKYGLIPSYHPHLGTIVEAPDQLDKLLSLTEINLCPDTAHIEAGGGDAIQVIKKYADRIKYVHLKDYKEGEFLPLGEGKQNYHEMIEILKGAGYEGWITIELDSYHNPKKGAQISKNYLKDHFGLI